MKRCWPWTHCWHYFFNGKPKGCQGQPKTGRDWWLLVRTSKSSVGKECCRCGQVRGES